MAFIAAANVITS